MTNIELYINGKLCDTQQPENMGIRLNRVLVNPSELSTKDAQYSYSITLPSSPINDEVFGYANVEEVRAKFNNAYTAVLIMDGITIFDGLFKMSEVTPSEYKGNLVLPAEKTVKDIFGEKKMNELPKEWTCKMEGTKEEAINAMNQSTEPDADCMFPFVLYGLLPKVPKIELEKGDEDEAPTEKQSYTNKDAWDEYVRLGIEDFPPSINCLKTIEHIFSSHGYTITGNVFDDERLQRLYMSYQNPTDYAQQWNWGDLAQIEVEGNWTNWKGEVSSPASELEESKVIKEHESEQFYFKNEDDQVVYAANLLSSSTTRITKLTDSGTNVTHSVTGSVETKDRKSNTMITVPVSGLYKISLEIPRFRLENTYKNLTFRRKDPTVITAHSAGFSSNFNKRAYEIKLLRDWGEGSFDMSEVAIDSTFYKDNMPQTANFEQYDSDKEVENVNDFPKYFPIPGKKCVQFIDPCVNEKLLSGFHWGRLKGVDIDFPRNQKDFDKQFGFDYDDNSRKLEDQDYLCRMLAIKPGWSHDVQYSQKDKIYSAVNNQRKLPNINDYGIMDENDSQPKGCWRYGPSVSISTPPVGEEEKISSPYGWYPDDRFKVEIEKSPDNEIKYGTEDDPKGWDSGSGKIHQIVWLNKGEHITLVAVSNEGINRGPTGAYGWVKQDIDFKLKIEAFKTAENWIKINNNATGTEMMNWFDPSSENTFLKGKIDLVKFLPSEVKVDDWLTNFCKVFNLSLKQDGESLFRLDSNQTLQKSIYSVLDLSDKVNLIQRSNQPLGLPSAFELSFKINEEEEGLNETNYKKDEIRRGDGRFETGALDGAVVSQSSSFSFNWFKKIEKNKLDVNVAQSEDDKDFLDFPVISNKEVWKPINKSLQQDDYAEMQAKIYTNFAQRFWYKKVSSDKIFDLGVIWKSADIGNGETAKNVFIPMLSNSFMDETEADKERLDLTYEDKPNSILRSYFSLIAPSESNYTEVECFLTPDEYDRMDGSTIVRMNDDLYYVSTIEGYDPLGKNKTKLKLIRKLLS